MRNVLATERGRAPTGNSASCQHDPPVGATSDGTAIVCPIAHIDALHAINASLVGKVLWHDIATIWTTDLDSLTATSAIV